MLLFDRFRSRETVQDPSLIEGVETADIIEPGDMIHVRVGDNHGIDLTDSQVQTGLTEFRRRIDDEGGSAGLNIKTRPPPRVPRVGRSTGRAPATDLGDSHTGACAQELNGEISFHFSSL